MPKRYVLVDCQSIQPARPLRGDPARTQMMAFLGPNQSEATARKRLGDKARYIKISGEGHGALDFHIAYYVGELVTREPGCDVWIVSKDKGFRRLVEHLAQRNFKVHQVPDLAFVQDGPVASIAVTSIDPAPAMTADRDREDGTT